MSNWIPREQVHEATGRGVAWLYNRVEDGRIRREYRIVDGKRYAYFHAGDVEQEMNTHTPRRVSIEKQLAAARRGPRIPSVDEWVRVHRSPGNGALLDEQPSEGVVVAVHERYAIVRFHADDKRRAYDEAFHFVDLRKAEAMQRAG